MPGIKETIEFLDAIDAGATAIKKARVAIKDGDQILDELKNLDAMEIKNLFAKAVSVGKNLWKAIKEPV